MPRPKAKAQPSLSCPSCSLRLQQLRSLAYDALLSVHQVERCQVAFGLQDFGSWEHKGSVQGSVDRGQGPGTGTEVCVLPCAWQLRLQAVGQWQ